MSRICVVAAVLGVSAAFAQTPRPEFEVASIKPSSSIQESVKVGLHIDGAQVHIGQFSLKDYLLMAFNVKIYQLEGPDWLSSARFDIDAKIPQGGSQTDVRRMLQSLLEDRFGLKVHRGSKELAVYGLLVGSDGPKMKEAEVDPADPAPAAGGVDVKVTGGRNGVNINYGHGTYFAFANSRIEGKKLTMPLFADILGRFVDRPVIDMTKLTAAYDFTLDLTQEDYTAMLIRSAVIAGVTLPPEAMRLMNNSDDSLMMALRRLGLKLETRKAPVETVVVDEMRKTPSAN